MNILNNKNKRTSIFKALALCLFAAVSLTLASCDDDMDIQQSYPFTVETMPVPNKVTKGQTVEIRCELEKDGRLCQHALHHPVFPVRGGRYAENGGRHNFPAQRPLPARKREVPAVLHGRGRRGAQLHRGGGGQFQKFLRIGI